MAVLVVADNDNAHLRDGTHKTVTAALKISGDVDVLVLGKGAKAVADAAAKIAGVRKVLLAESDALGHGCLLYTSPSPRDRQKSRMPSSA